MQARAEQTISGKRLEPAHLRHILGHFCTRSHHRHRDGNRAAAGRVRMPVVRLPVPLSRKPPLVPFSVSRFYRSWQGIHRAGRCCINILTEEEEPLYRRFAAPDADRFTGRTGDRAPVLWVTPAGGGAVLGRLHDRDGVSRR
jgi:3-hydroxy-9,10-secoandrosta-1,3,5(10)-triene-9,17-dione monooxygenase reductase component